MDRSSLESSLADLPVSAIRYFDTIDSTNDEAWRWLERGAPHYALVVADEQTAGRGRLRRRWVTAAGSGLAFSLVLLSPPLDPSLLTRLTGLGAVSACQALGSQYDLLAQVKWPNDILLHGRKAGGVLVESRWQGQQLQAVVVGVGINIASQSISPEILPAQGLNFPATCIELVLGRPVDRMELLHAVLEEFFSWLPRLGTPGFLSAWEGHLAYLGQWVELSAPAGSPGSSPAQPIRGEVAGLNEDGSLRLIDATGQSITVQAGEIQLRPVIHPPYG